MQRYIIQRLIAAIPVLFIVALVIFALLRIAPGDPAALFAGNDATPERIEALREGLGLNQPLPVQLGIWFRDILKGDLGTSLTSHHKVTELIWSRVVPTLSLTVLTELFTVCVGVPLGVLAAWKANSWIDRLVMLFASLGFSIPVFFLGFMMIWLFALQLGFFPPAGYVEPTENLWRYFHRLIMPSIATSTILIAYITRMTRASLLEVLREDYIRTARSKGLTETIILVRHALKNSALPIITVIGLGFAALLSGLVVTEQVFAIPGVGRLVIDAIVRRDYPVIQGAILLVSVVYVFVNLLVDLSYAYFDPRIRY